MRRIRKTKVSINADIQKPLVLDMKCETRDINVTERVNVPKFSKLDNTVTPFTFLELFFDYVLVDMIVGFPK